MASSRSRAELRAKSRLAKFTHAISKIRLTAPISRKSMGRRSCARVSESLSSCHSDSPIDRVRGRQSRRYGRQICLRLFNRNARPHPRQ